MRGRGDGHGAWRGCLQVAISLLVLVGGWRCGSPLAPETGLATVNDPGKIRVNVLDEQGAPVRGAYVGVEMPNKDGRLFTEAAWTDANGTITFLAVPAGIRTVTVRPPAGFMGTPGSPLIREVRVVKGITVTVQFQLVHAPPR